MELEMNSEMMMDMRACVSHATLPPFAPEALELHEGIAKRLWATSLKGVEAADHVDALIARHGIR